MKSTKEIFIENLRQLRESRGFTQASFAEETGFSVRGYQKYELGQTEVTPTAIDTFCTALGCQPKDLVLEMGAMNVKSDLIVSIVALLPALDEGQLRRLLSTATNLSSGPSASSTRKTTLSK